MSSSRDLPQTASGATLGMDRHAKNLWRMMDAVFDPTRPAGCAHCGEADEFSPNVEAFEICGELLCDECSEQVFEDNGQFGVGA